MKKSKFTECNYCGVEFNVVFIDSDETEKFCPSCGESLEDYILGEDETFQDEDMKEWYDTEE